MVLTIKEVTNHLMTLIQFFEPVQSLGNAHFASFFTEHLWDAVIPNNVQSELKSMNSINDLIQLYPAIIRNKCSNDFAENHPNLVKFLQTAVNVSINKEEKYLKLLSDLKNLSVSSGHEKTCEIEMEDFMSPKKLHEVKMASKMAALLTKLTKSSHIVDVGGGKGYLSCILALHYSFKVLGLDSSEITTCGAVKRSQKVAKMWTGDIFKDFEQKKSTKKDKEEYIQRHYKQFLTFVTPDTDIEELLMKGFHEDIAGITITGLHTCGNLAPTSLKMFLNNNKIRGILNVGCCYHLLNEEYCPEDSDETTKNYGFPLSNFLKNKKYRLGRNARMLAAHSPDKITSNLESELSQASVFYRAILETVISEDKVQRGQVRRLAKKCKDFHEYMSAALKKLGSDVQLKKNELDKLYEQYVGKKQFLTAFYLLRISLAPVVESIVLLDRILYLLENGVSNVYLVPLFNLEISPRGFGIIAWKNYDKSELVNRP